MHDTNDSEKTFWQIVADPKHPFWKWIYVALVVPAMYLTVQNFDSSELEILMKWAGGAGGLAGILQIAKVWVNKQS